jgi:hypothetical protein
MMRMLRTFAIVAVLVATMAGQAGSPLASSDQARLMTTAELSAARGSLAWYECFLLGAGIGIGCSLSGGLGCAAIILTSAGTGGLDCLR